MTQLEKDLIHLWDNFSVKPTYLQMKLGQLRKLQAERGDAKDYVVKFLEETANMPDDAIAVLTPGRISLLTDGEGNLLGFR